jgi:uncharacterized protein (TIGR00369 family)
MNDKRTTAKEVFDPTAHGWERFHGHNFGELVGPIWRRGDNLFGFLAADKHRNHIGRVHGGMLMTFADQAMGMTGRRATGEKPHATITLNMQFIGAVDVGDFVEAHCDIVRMTRSVLFIDSKVKVGARIVATGSGIWKILGER